MWFSRLRGHSTPFRPLGQLERSLLERVWERGEVTVRDLHQRYQPRLAYTTVMTTLDRLYKKGLLQRRKSGRSFCYSPAMSRAQFGEALARHALELMLDYAQPAPQAVLSSFVNAVSDSDAQLLAELERLVKSKRRARKRSE